MNKGRVEAFTDAVVAIIMTIMVLEFKTLEEPTLEALFSEAPYLFAYIVSFVFICVAWYNHHYMFALADRISKRTFWVNNFWMFTMSLLPMAAAWAGNSIDDRVPEYFYIVIFFLWSLAYLFLTKSIAKDLDVTSPEKAAKIRSMPPYKFMTSILFPIAIIVATVAVYFFPPAGLILTLIELVYMAFNTTPDSDRIEGME